MAAYVLVGQCVHEMSFSFEKAGDFLTIVQKNKNPVVCPIEVNWSVYSESLCGLDLLDLPFEEKQREVIVLSTEIAKNILNSYIVRPFCFFSEKDRETFYDCLIEGVKRKLISCKNVREGRLIPTFSRPIDRTGGLAAIAQRL